MISRLLLSFVVCACCSKLVYADSADGGLDSIGVVAERGNVKLTLQDIDVVLDKVPTEDRSAVIASPDRLQHILDTELLNKQIAQRGRDMNLMGSPMIQKLVERAAEQAFAKITVEQIIKDTKRPNFALLASEYYTVNSADFSTPVTSVVQHILISKTGRTSSEILARVQDVVKKAQVPGADFAALVSEYSDDPSKSDNDGVMTVGASGEFVPTFEAAAHELKKEGDLTQVDTEYGTHVMRLVRRTAAGLKTFESVREEIITKLSSEFEEGIRSKFFSDLRSANPVFHEDMIEVVRKRYGELPQIGNESVVPPAAPAVDGTK